MTNYLFPTNLGTRFKYDRWDIGLWLGTDDPILGGKPLILGYDDPGTGWVSVAFIEPPRSDADWAAMVAAAGGMGNYIVSKFPAIKAALTKYFDTTPDIPLVTNQTPFSRDNFNAMLQQWIGLKDDPGTGHPTVYVKSNP